MSNNDNILHSQYLPFNNISDAELKYITLNKLTSTLNLNQILNSQLDDPLEDLVSNQCFNPPDALSSNITNQSCRYITLDDLASQSYDPHTFSILQLNCRSIKKL